MIRWMEHANRINRGMQKAAVEFTKEANNIFGTHNINSYAFHSKSLMNTLQTILPQSDKKRVE